MIRADI